MNAALDSPPSGRTRWAAVLVGFALFLATLIAYAPIRANDFIDLDDESYITENPNVHAGLTDESIRWAWTADRGGYWQPLMWMSLQLDVTLFGYHAWAIHLTNVLLHAATSVLLFVLFAQLTDAFWRSALLAALFALHPLHVESVAWAAERKDVLSTFFLVLTIGAYAWTVRKPTWGRHVLTAALFTLGLLAKPMLVTLPFALLLLDVWPLGRWQPWGLPVAAPATAAPLPLGRLLREKALLFALAIGCSAITLRLQRELGGMFTFEEITPASRLVNALNGTVWYLQKTLAPIDIAFFYPHRLSLPAAEGLLSGGLVIGITLGLAARFRSQPELLVGWLWFLGTLFPVSGVAQSGEQAYAARFAYVPHIGLFITLVWGAGSIAAWSAIRPGLLGVAAALVLLVFGALTREQVRRYLDAETLWKHTLALTGDDNGRAHLNLGVFQLKKGMPTQAVEHLQRAIELSPIVAAQEGYNNLGIAFYQLGQVAEARRAFERALEGNPQHPDVRYNLAVALLASGDRDAGILLLEESLKRTPSKREAAELLERLRTPGRSP